nr:SufD family Fe-S cluster assembly protein [uncultured Olsenella sp.]
MAETIAEAPSYAAVEHVNQPPAQTWNHLRINGCSLRLPSPARKGEVLARLPRVFSQLECGIGDEAVSWVESVAGDARYVEVPQGTRRAEPIVVDVDASGFAVEDTGVMLREGSEATVVVSVRGQGGHSASLLRVIAEAGSRLHLVEVVAPGSGSTHLEGVGIEAAEGARIEVRQYALGGKSLAMGFATKLGGTSSRLQLDCRYVVRDADELDVNHVVRQLGRNSRSDIVTSGFLGERAHKAMRETIDLTHGAKGARGNETETVLMGGDEVVNKTLPVILCDEDDVQGNHGASIGSVSAEQLGYLTDRGLSEEEVNDLFVRAIFDDAAIHAPEASSREAALARAEQLLGPEAARDVAEGLGLSPATTDAREVSA